MTFQKGDQSFQCRVSSVLNRDTKNYGKQHMFDDLDETCWNSDQGIPQWILLHFEDEITLQSMDIQFQGGFVGTGFHLEAGPDSKNMETVQEFHPEDVNSIQRFDLDKTKTSKYFKLVFNSSTDFFGRIIIYKLLLNS